MVSPKGLFFNCLAGFTKNVKGSGAVCDQKTSKFFHIPPERIHGETHSVKGVY
jgi:hypothetical protein